MEVSIVKKKEKTINDIIIGDCFVFIFDCNAICIRVPYSGGIFIDNKEAKSKCFYYNTMSKIVWSSVPSAVVKSRKGILNIT
jgi:hypothetical protein